ncbi:uncharacterized protein LOC119101908 [Pollicipes pollicipes]|uniref:uncharacterized protein LOC119101907 n=1 Tax=Pollicipes pollicipes TaxID=41117 RepID=UPI001884D16C|nr:uncharacterized protein LOC119101907 [Pollicipes pollicipes]XP_037081193.1 uncharacterized protein LOC119101908 [Pollicipes pollicipes]
MKWTVVLLVSLFCGLTAAKCKYRRDGDWGACSAEGVRSRTDVLKAEKSDPSCQASRNITKVCREDCQYVRRRQASWAECDRTSNTIAATRTLVSGDGCPAQVIELFDCRIQRRFGQGGRRRRPGKKAGGRRKGQKKQQRRKDKQQRRTQRKQGRQQRRQNQNRKSQN